MAVLSEFLVGTIESVRHSVGITEVFVGVIVVAIVGNAAEHSTAIMMAMKNKMDLSVGIAIGSSLQIALFVAPLLVFLSYFFGRPMDLELDAGNLCGRRLGLHPVSDQWRRGDELDRRRPTSLGLCDSGDSFLLSPGAATHLALSDQGGDGRERERERESSRNETPCFADRQRECPSTKELYETSCLNRC